MAQNNKLLSHPIVPTMVLYCGRCDTSYTDTQVPEGLCPDCDEPLMILGHISSS